MKFGNHSNTHPHVNNLSLEKNMEEIQKCSEKIEKITGKKTTLYRGPYGEYNETVIRAAKAQNQTTIQWNLDTLDYSGLTGEQMWKRIENKLEAGSIILSHNGTKHTAESLDMLIHNIQEKGYKIVTVSDLIYKDNFYIDVIMLYFIHTVNMFMFAYGIDYFIKFFYSFYSLILVS